MSDFQEEDSGVEVDAGVIPDNEQNEATPQLTHSWSRLSMFQTCPQQYKLFHLDKKQGEVNPLTLVGRVCHDAIGLYNQHCIKNKIPHDFDRWKEFAWKAIERGVLPQEYNEEIFTLMKQYAETHEVDLESVVGAEEKISINRNREQVDWLAPDVWLRAVVDFLQISGNVAKITDYKTTWAMKSDPFQLKIYAWMVKQIYPHVTDFQIEIDYIRHEFQSTVTFTDEDFEDIEKAILSKTNRVESETEWKPNVGVQCSYCPVWYACPAMKEMGEVRRYPEPKAEAEAVALALELEKHSKLASEAKKVLKEYCDKHGALVAGGRLYRFNPSSKYEFDISELFVAFDQIGLNLLEYLTLDYRKFKAALNDERVEHIAKKIGNKKVSVTFSSKKASDGEDND